MSQKLLQWEKIDEVKQQFIQRAKVPGGWLVMVTETQEVYARVRDNINFSSSVCFVPDPLDAWQPTQDIHS